MKIATTQIYFLKELFSKRLTYKKTSLFLLFAFFNVGHIYADAVDRDHINGESNATCMEVATYVDELVTTISIAPGDACTNIIDMTTNAEGCVDHKYDWGVTTVDNNYWEPNSMFRSTTTFLATQCCPNDNREYSPSFEGDLTPAEKFPDATTTSTNNAIISQPFSNPWEIWRGFGDGVFDIDVISDATRASDGEEFVYITYDSGGSSNYCVRNGNSKVTVDPTTEACGTGAGTIKQNIRYVACYDWVPFDKVNPSGTTKTTQPTMETVDATGSLHEETMYDASGNSGTGTGTGTGTATARAGVSWANVSSSWEQVCATFTLNLAVGDNSAYYYSHEAADNSDMLIDNIILQEIGNISVASMNLSVTQTTCTDNGNGTFTAAYDATIDWASKPSTVGETINVTHNGTTIGTIDPSTDTSPSVFSVNINANGAGTQSFKAAFTTDICPADSISFKTPVPCPADVAACSAATGCLGGNTFEDFNCNGVDDTNEPGVQGIQVVIYDYQNNAVDTVWTDSDGDWLLCGLDVAAYRVEFILPESIACWASPTHVGSDNGSDVQFLTAPACTQFSVSSPADYCEGSSDLLSVCFFAPSDTNTDGDVLISIPNQSTSGSTSTTDDTGYEVPNIHPIDIPYSQIGSVWGLAYKRNTRQIFASAYAKAATEIAPGTTLGTILLVDNSVNDGTDANITTATSFIDLNDSAYFNGAFGDVISGTDSLAVVSRFADRTKKGMGDLDISDDGKSLFTINLATRQLFEIPVGDNGVAPAKSEIIITDAPSPSNCGGDVVRPFGLKFYKGKLYVGMVCTAENTKDSTNLRAYVYTYEQGSGRFQNSLVLEFPLDFERGQTRTNLDGEWRPWIDTWDDSIYDVVTTPSKTLISYAQPILSDIEFDRGDMLLGFMDRIGEQHKDGGYPSSNFSPNNISPIPGGDLLRAGNNGDGTWTIENNGSVTGIQTGTITTTGAGNDQGPATLTNDDWTGDYGEYYLGDFYATHREIVIGGLTQFPGQEDIISTVYDPVQPIAGQFGQGGLIWIDNQTGLWKRGWKGYSGAVVQYGKGNGFGDLEALCGEAPLEIGNYVWCDSLENGIQDGCERGISDIIVQLYDRNGKLVGQDTTVNGQYSFNQKNVDTTGITVAAGVATPAIVWSGMSYSTQYFIVFGGGQFATDEFTVGSDTYGITSVVNTGSNDNIDSDVDGSALTAGSLGTRPGGLPFIDITTSATGCGDHKYDMGILCAPEVCEIPLIYEQCGCAPSACNLTIQQVYANTVSCTGGTGGTIDMNVIVNYVNAPAGDIDINGTNFTPNGTSGIDTFLLTGLPCTSKDSMEIVAQFVNNTTCSQTINTGLKFADPRYDVLGWDCEDASGSQIFNNWKGSGVNVTISNSDNMYDGPPNIYEVTCPNGNDDTHCLPQYHGTLRYTNNRNSVAGQPRGTATGPSYIKYAFDEPVFIDDFMIGSISILALNTSEWVHVLAYDTSGALTFPTHYSTGGTNCENIGTEIPINVIPGDDCSIYAAGASDGTNGGDKIYGHLQLAYTNTPVDSIIIEFWGSPDNFTDPEGAHGDRFCSATMNTFIIEPATCNCCPEITELVTTRTICHGENVDTLAALTTFENPDSIAFVYFTSAQTDSSVIYTGGIGIDTVQITSGNDTARITDISGFTSTSGTTTYYVYAIAYPTPAINICRPYEEIIVTVNAKPTASIFAIQPSCVNNIAQSDGYFQLSAVSNGDKINFSTGNTYTGDADYANATTIGALPFQFNTGLANPNGTQDYTIRVFNGASDCFVDRTVTINEVDCCGPKKCLPVTVTICRGSKN